MIKVSFLTALKVLLCALLGHCRGTPTQHNKFNSSVLTSIKIVNGQDANPGQFPYQVSLLMGGRSVCGGSLLSNRHVLTAAHCVHRQSAQSFQVMAGILNSAFGGQMSGVREIKVHHSYYNVINGNDIAVLVLSNPFTLNSVVSVVSLPTQAPSENQECTVSGWGRLYTNGPSSQNLRFANVPYVPYASCQRIYSSASGGVRIPSTVICAGGRGSDSCNGDSGGALTLRGSNIQVGIVSFGLPSGCAQIGIPTAYTNVAMFGNWIREQMSEEGAGVGQECSRLLQLCRLYSYYCYIYQQSCLSIWG